MGNTDATRVLDAATRLVEGTRPDQLDDPTPCSEWDVRGLLNHFVGGGHMFAAAFRGQGTDDMADIPSDVLGDDHVQAWKAARADFESAIAEPGALDRDVTLPFATMPGTVVMDLLTFDLAVHCWDLARATGQAHGLPDDLVAVAEEKGRMLIAPEMRVPGFFSAEAEAPAGATALDRLAAFAGRRP